jgi:hypothetical protein
VLAGPVGFLVTGWWYRRQQVRDGVGPGRGSYTAAGLVAMAVLQRKVYLAFWAVVFGALGVVLRSTPRPGCARWSTSGPASGS